MNKIKLNWKEFDDMINKLCKQILSSNIKVKNIFGIPRGGLILAVCLSHKLKLPLSIIPSSKSLIVDDISDTGKTLRTYKDFNYIVTLFTTDWTNVIPNFWISKKLNKNDWIVFPWEQDE